MPQASKEQRIEWNGPDSEYAVMYLQERDYKLTIDYLWRKPSEFYSPTEKELSAIQFLIDEWGFGGLE